MILKAFDDHFAESYFASVPQVLIMFRPSLMLNL